MTDFILAELASKPGQRPRELVRTLIERTGKPYPSASAGVSTTLTRLRGQRKVRKVGDAWRLA